MNPSIFLTVLLSVWLIAITISVIAVWVELRAMKLSTHKVQFVNPLGNEEQQFQPVTEEVLKGFNIDGGNV